MSADLEEVDVQQQLKKAEESGDDTESIVLSEKSGLDTEEEEIQVNEDILDDVKEEGQENDSWNWMTDDTNDKEIKLEIIDNKPSSTLLYNDNSPLIEGDIPEGLQEEIDKLDDDDDDDEDDEDDEEYNENLRKLENDINKDYLYSYHPETKHINYKELLTLSNVTRNKKGIIIDPLHQTIPLLTRYEKAKILGLRAKQINHGAKPFVELTKDIIDGHTIAFMELTQNKIPFIIRRPMPNGGSEYWKISDLKNID